MGVSLAVSAPLGRYDEDRVVNIGTNRWSFKPEVGISKALGPLSLELAAGVSFFTKNDDFLGETREQDPLFSAQAHAVYDIGGGIWAALTATYLEGGRTTVGGVENDDGRSNVRLGASLSLPVTRHHSVKVYGSTAIRTRRGGAFDVVGVVWQYRWGAGL